jgi:shingomyelin synthase
MAFILTHPRRFLIMRRIAIVFAVLFIFRAFTVTVTSLPDASPTCVAQFTNETGAYKREKMFPKACGALVCPHAASPFARVCRTTG